jgi:hypothetical protein
MEPVALPFDVDGAGVMEQAIQDGRRDDRIAEDLARSTEALIARPVALSTGMKQ